MELGQRIRAARLELGLSQRQLCGDTITRNMLSQIENGSARPSMATLGYLASRLGKSVSYFLEEEAVLSPNQAVMAKARGCYDAGDFSGLLSALEDYRTPDETYDREKALLYHLGLLNLAEQAIVGGRLPYARSLLARWETFAYETPELRSRYQLLLARCDPALGAEVHCDEALLLRAKAALAAGDGARCLEILGASEDKTAPQWNLLRGEAFFALADYASAARCLERAEAAFPEATIAKLEICHRELGDFQKAYEYACKRR